MQRESTEPEDDYLENVTMIPDMNRKFALLNGLCWHEMVVIDGRHVCSCGKNFGLSVYAGDHKDYCNPDFSNSREVLRVVMEREDWEEFFVRVGKLECNRPWANSYSFYIDLDYITTPGKLRDAWIEWKEAQK
jgi:hypothetical protein